VARDSWQNHKRYTVSTELLRPTGKAEAKKRRSANQGGLIWSRTVPETPGTSCQPFAS
jgi:hypothetical protein